MRVIAGTARGIPLAAPRGMATRPTADRLKENLFNILAPYIPGAKFLDLYSGSGAIGIEALSRGALSAVMVENAANSVETIKINVQKTKFTNHTTIIRLSAEKAIAFLKNNNMQFNIIFLDPPYDKKMVPTTLSWLDEAKLLIENGIIVAEMPTQEIGEPVGNYILQKEKIYGETKFVWYTEEKT